VEIDMSDVYIIGVGMTRFGQYLEKSVKKLTEEAVVDVLNDAGVVLKQIEAAWFSNSLWGYYTNQHMIRGEVALRPLGLEGLPIINVENACASAATALHCGWMAIKAGSYDCVLAVGAEKIYNEDREKMFFSFSSGTDVEKMNEHLEMWKEVKNRVNLKIPSEYEQSEMIGGKSKSSFMDIYAGICHWHMAKFGTTQRQLAIISAKNHYHGSMNPKAQIRKNLTVEEVLKDKVIAWPLTRPMCAPVGDGASAAILCSERYFKENNINKSRAVKIRASVLGSGTDRELNGEDIGHRVSKEAYEMAGIDPSDINLAEVHDATAVGELHQTEVLGFCSLGKGGIFAESGATALGGKMPINTSGGLESRGHPIGASGLAQIYELVMQLRGEAGPRQVENARMALAENGGGNLGYEEAAMGIHILEKAGKGKR
jgi:acetyl-CoA acetyltransferase